MQADLDGTPVESDAQSIVAAERSRHDLVRCGAELVGLSERFYGGVFVGGVIFVGLAALVALAVLPFRHYALPGGALALAVLATGLLVVAAPFAIWQAEALYRILRRRQSAQVGLLLVATLLIAYPIRRSELWWPSCAIVMLLATVVPFRRALAYCVAVLAASFASHAAGGDLREMSAVAIIGLCIGLPFWTAIVSLSTDRLAAYLLRLNATRERRRRPPRRVAAWTTPPPAKPAHTTQDADATTNTDRHADASSTRLILSADPTDTTTDAEDNKPTTRAIGRKAATDRLTARQLQVVALLADGLRYREIAACLSISKRQVQRHVVQAAARLGVHSAYELAAIAVSEGMVPNPTRSRDSGSSTHAGPTTADRGDGGDAPPPR